MGSSPQKSKPSPPQHRGRAPQMGTGQIQGFKLLPIASHTQQLLGVALLSHRRAPSIPQPPCPPL